MKEQAMAQVKIRRTSADGSLTNHYDCYEVPYESRNTVMDVLQYIYANIDGTLAHRCACNGAYCNVCLVRCNGKNINPCRTFMSKEMVIEPVPGHKVIRDLVVSFVSSEAGKK
ncbi:MAG: hypothetical protein GX779_03245 [Clostridia bacterium]|nr:hypothetical protein [Clostridia bacterium]